MEYVGAAAIVLFILYKLFGQNFFNKKLLESMVERISAPALTYPTTSNEEKVISMYFYYACLMFTCQKRNLSKFTRTIVDMAFRKTITNVFNYKELPDEDYARSLKHVFDIIGFLEKYPHPEVLQDLIISTNKNNNSKFGLNLTFDNLDVYAKASEFYIRKVGPTVDFLLETNKHYPN